MYKYAIKHEIVEKNYAIYCDVPTIERKCVRLPFTDEEIKILWENINKPFVDMILINIYSGLRPRELVEIKNCNIDLDNKFMIGGLKTKAGKNRIIPIHESIYDLIKKRYCENREFLCFKENFYPMSYDDYRNRFRKIMKQLGMNHKPHDTRHTFITLAKRFRMDEYIIKLIVGHKIEDITESTYTHRKRNELCDEINKICVL